MDHRTIQEYVFAVYDGEATASARRAVEDHLPHCASCRALLAQWQHVAGALLRQSPAVAPSATFVGRVMERLALYRHGKGLARPRAHARHSFPQMPDLRWLVPALTLASTVFLLLLTAPASRAVSVETLLFLDEPEPATLQQALITDTPSPEVLLGLLMEEPS